MFAAVWAPCENVIIGIIVVLYHCWEYLGICAIARTTYEYAIVGIIAIYAIVGRILAIRPLCGQHMDANMGTLFFLVVVGQYLRIHAII